MTFPTPDELNKKIADQDKEIFETCIREIESYLISKYTPGRRLTGTLSTPKISERIQQRIVSALQSKGWNISFKDRGTYCDPRDELSLSYEIGPAKPAASYSDQRESNPGWQRD